MCEHRVTRLAPANENSGRWSYKTNTIGCCARMNNSLMNEPVVIQGGMGVGVSNWRLAQAVSRMGQLGVVSGTALDQVFVRRLVDGDPCGAMRRALAAFPFPAIAQRLLADYFIPGGKQPSDPY